MIFVVTTLPGQLAGTPMCVFASSAGYPQIGFAINAEAMGAKCLSKQYYCIAGKASYHFAELEDHLS